MLILFIQKIEVVFELVKELYTIIKWDFKNMLYNVINVHLFFYKNEAIWYSSFFKLMLFSKSNSTKHNF
jgi:hypothetical protein